MKHLKLFTKHKMLILNHSAAKGGRLYSTNTDLWCVTPAIDGMEESALYDNNLLAQDIVEEKKDTAFNLDNFPAIPLELDLEPTVKVNVEQGALKSVVAVMSKETSRYYLNGVCFKSDMIEATDGYRLYRHFLAEKNGLVDGMIVPAGFLNQLIKHKQESYTFEFLPDMYVRAALESGIVYLSKLVYGTFPDTDRVIPNGEGESFFFDPSALKKEKARIKAYLDGGTAVLVNGNTVKAVRKDFSEREFSSVGNCPVGIAFNYKYLIEAPAGKMAFTDTKSPVRIDTVTGDIFVLMPLAV